MKYSLTTFGQERLFGAALFFMLVGRRLTFVSRSSVLSHPCLDRNAAVPSALVKPAPAEPEKLTDFAHGVVIGGVM